MIPVLINNRDLLDTTIAQLEFFRKCPDAYPVIVDNASTYPPLLEWYRDMTGCQPLPSEYKGRNIHFHFLPINIGPRAATSVLFSIPFKFTHYYLSESDLDYTGCDPHFLADLQAGLDRYPNMEGAGVSIRIDDLPDTELAKVTRIYEGPNWQEFQTLRTEVYDRETRQQHYVGGDDLDWYKSATDTAGVLRRYSPTWSGGYQGIRSVKHVIRHRPWYFLPENWSCPICKVGTNAVEPDYYCEGCETGINPPEDFKYYYAHANPAGTAYTSFILDPSRSK